MPIIQQFKSQLEQVSALKVIAGAFSEISSSKIDAIKESFDQNALYYEEISQLYQLVKRFDKSKKASQPDQIKPKTLFIAVTSNHGFYGPINSDAIDKMHEDNIQQQPDSCMIIGKIGISYARSTNKLSSFNAISFEKDDPTTDETQAILDKTQEFNRIYLYFPKFITMFSQKIDRIDITYSPQLLSNIPQAKVKYIIEPELSKILSFFEKQVRYILFLRVMLETQLSRTATRLISMDGAERRATDVAKQLKMDISQLYRSEINAQQIASSGQLKKWRNRI